MDHEDPVPITRQNWKEQALLLDHGNRSVAASRHGGQVLSWVARGRERLFLSPNASFEPGRPVRGGIPVIFPQFSERGEGLRHGFARLHEWTADPGVTAAADRLSFVLQEDARTLETWPHRFRARLEVGLLPDRLDVQLQVSNRDEHAFTFTAALHTYLLVDDLKQVRIHGLEGRPYLDTAHNNAPRKSSGEAIRLQGEVDRIYPGANGPLRLVDGPGTLALESSGFPDTVIWNPGADLAGRIPDLGEGHHLRFLCIEAAAVESPIRLAPGETWRGRQSLVLEPAPRTSAAG